MQPNIKTKKYNLPIIVALLHIFFIPNVIAETPTKKDSKIEVSTTNKDQLPVKEHYTGTVGEAKPSAEEIMAAQQKFLNEMKSESLAVNLDKSEIPADAQIKTIVMPDCIAGGAATENFDEKDLLGTERTVLDLIFVQNMPSDLDAKEVFGKDAKVVVVSEEFSDPITQAAIVMGIECLPTRLIRTNKKRQWLEGRNAFLNYDENSAGKMHPLVQSKFEQTLKK